MAQFNKTLWELQLAFSSIELFPLSLNSTMLLTGEADYRTPISESQQYYLALKLRKIDAAMVRMPGASRDRRPSESSSAQGCLHLEVA